MQIRRSSSCSWATNATSSTCKRCSPTMPRVSPSRITSLSSRRRPWTQPTLMCAAHACCRHAWGACDLERLAQAPHATCQRRTPVRGALPRLPDPASPSLHVGRTPRPRASFLPIPVRTCTSRPQVAFETILIEIYRIVTRKTLEAGGEGPKPGGETTKIVLDKVGSKKKGGCC